MKKRILSFLLAVMLCMSLLAVNVSAADVTDYGVCGDNLTWTLFGGVLTISGKGEMTSWTSTTNTMWSNYRNTITSVVIEEGVTGIADYAFYGCKALTSVSLPSTLISIGNYAFAFSSALESIEIPQSVSGIASHAFEYCTSLKSVSLTEYLVELGENAFYGCSSLTEITLPATVVAVRNQAFAQCKKLSAVTVKNDATAFGRDVFAGTAAVLYGNSGSTAEAYAGANGLAFSGAHASHVFGDWTVTKEASCTETGSRTRTCEGCDESETEEIPALGHTPGDAATCENAQVCTVCDAVLTPALDHTPGAAATCESAQVCTVCDAVLTPALDHTPGTDVSCTEDQVCTVCGKVLKEATDHVPGEASTCEDQLCTVCGEVVAAAPHVPGAAATCSHVQSCKLCDKVLASRIPHTPGDAATCTTTQNCTVCGEVVAEALGHTPGDAATCTTTQNCTVCGEILHDVIPHAFSEPIIYENHPHDFHAICPDCGEFKDTPNDPTYLHPNCSECYPYFTLAGANMTLGNDLSLNFYIPKASVYDDTYYAVITKYYADGTEPLVLTIPCTEWSSYSSSLYRVSLTGLSAKEMADTITVEVFNGNGYNVSELWTDSIKAYLMRNIDRPNFDAEEKTWAVDTLNYGAAAQLHFGYNTGSLANADLTEEQQALGSQSVSMNNTRVMTGKCAGSSLSLENNISLNVYFTGITNTEGMYATVFYTDHYGNNIDITVYAADFRKNGNLYGVSVNSMVAADASQPITVIMYNANNTVYGRCTDSVESYSARMSEGDDLFTAVMKFAAASYAMFH